MSLRCLHCVYYKFDDPNDCGGECLLKKAKVPYCFAKACESMVRRPSIAISCYLFNEDFVDDWSASDTMAYSYMSKNNINDYPFIFEEVEK